MFLELGVGNQITVFWLWVSCLICFYPSVVSILLVFGLNLVEIYGFSVKKWANTDGDLIGNILSEQLVEREPKARFF